MCGGDEIVSVVDHRRERLRAQGCEIGAARRVSVLSRLALVVVVAISPSPHLCAGGGIFGGVSRVPYRSRDPTRMGIDEKGARSTARERAIALFDMNALCGRGVGACEPGVGGMLLNWPCGGVDGTAAYIPAWPPAGPGTNPPEYCGWWPGEKPAGTYPMGTTGGGDGAGGYWYPLLFRPGGG